MYVYIYISLFIYTHYFLDCFHISCLLDVDLVFGVFRKENEAQTAQVPLPSMVRERFLWILQEIGQK